MITLPSTLTTVDLQHGYRSDGLIHGEHAMTFHQFVGRLDGEGAFAVVETDNPNDVLDASAKFAPLKVFTVYPVVDITEWAQKLQEGVEFRESIG